jgi:hypothetical protein
MTKISLESVTNAELIKHFEEFAIIHGRLRNAKEANRAFTDAVAVWGEICRRGQDAVEKFLALLESNDPTIRLAAAGKALFVAPEKAELVLEKLTEEKSILALDAKMTLRDWRAGRLKMFLVLWFNV